MTKNLRRIGNYYEQLAGQYLQSYNYEIIQYNYQYQTIDYYKPLEIDIIALKNNVLYFFEVKYRSNNINNNFFPIGPKKIKNFIECIKNFLYYNIQFNNYYINIGCVFINKNSIELWENIIPSLDH